MVCADCRNPFARSVYFSNSMINNPRLRTLVRKDVHADRRNDCRRSAPEGLRSTPMLYGYRNMIYYPGNTRRLPGCAFGLLTFRPGPHRAFEDDLTAISFDSDPARVYLGAAPKGLLDLAFDLGWLDTRLELDRVDHAPHAFEPAARPLGLLALIIPLDLALERHPSLVDDYLDLLPGKRQVALDRGHRIARDLRIGPLIGGGKTAPQ